MLHLRYVSQNNSHVITLTSNSQTLSVFNIKTSVHHTTTTILDKIFYVIKITLLE